MQPDPELSAANSVTVAYVCNNMVEYSWHRSMIELLAFDSRNSHRVMNGGFIAMRCGTNGLVTARNTAVKTFLAADDADWLFWTDTDMAFGADTVERLIQAADPEKRPVVGALCFGWREDKADGMGGYRHTAVPTLYDWAHVDGQYGWQIRWKYKTNALTQVGATGAACVLIHRSVFEKIEQEYGRVWYDQVPNTSTGQLIGEDMSFCLRAGALKIPIYVHTGVPTTHHKSLWVGEEDYWRQVALNSAAEAMSADPKSAVDSAAKLIQEGHTSEEVLATVMGDPA